MARKKIIKRREELIHKLETMPDNALAKEFHITKERVRQLRKEKGIPVRHPTRPRRIPQPAAGRDRRKKPGGTEEYKDDLSAIKTFEIPRKE